MRKDPDHPRMPVGLAADELLQLPAQRPLHPTLTGQVNAIHGLRLRRFFAAQFSEMKIFVQHRIDLHITFFFNDTLHNGVESRWSDLEEIEKHSSSVSDPDWIRNQLGQRIRMRIPNPDPDPDSSKLAPTKGKMKKFHV
jgi:hypothetical protein